jgi:BirA family transcriptional regulator, biotin operon repressor / biotin---[acetyl-CoA-carboxylase] ligase
MDRGTERWEGRTSAELARDWGLPAVHLFATVSSTNDVARRLAEGGAPAGTLVLADAQTECRGQHGRSWHSVPGLGLWMSVVLRPGRDSAPGVLPLLVGIAAARALDPFCGGTLSIKWPNDLLLDDRKLGGILCEGAWEAMGPLYVIAGLGLNVLHEVDDFASEIRSTATSVRLAGGRADRALIAGRVSRAIAGVDLSGGALLADAARDELEFRDALLGKPVLWTAPDGRELRGEALGIAPDGALLLRDAGGVVRVIRAGSVRSASSRDNESTN